MSAELEVADRRLLDRVQAGVPLVGRPFAALAAELGTDESDVLARLARLTDARVLRQLGAVFDTRACGYASALVAARVPASGLARAAAVIGAHPGVSHCYERAHAWNLWFTLAVAPGSRFGLERTAVLLGAAAAVESLRLLPALRTFKIAARFDLEEGGAGGATPGGAACASAVAAAPLTAAEIAVVRALQRPLPLVPEPFAAPARDAGMTEAELLGHAKALLARGVMRRFAGLLNHRRAGFSANVMAVWAVAPDRIAAAGARVAALAAVTHCYERPVFPDWPYALFSMIHGRSREEGLAVIGAIREAVRPDAAAALWTVREFKKTRLRLFTPDYGAWEQAVAEVLR